MTVKIKKVKDNAKIPKRATNGSAGMVSIMFMVFAVVFGLIQKKKSQSIRVSLCLFRQV